MKKCPPASARHFRPASAPPPSCTHAPFCWPASNARALHHRPPVSNVCVVLQTQVSQSVSQSRHPCRPEASGLGNQSATQHGPAAARASLMQVSYMRTTSQCRQSIPRYQSVSGLHREPAGRHRAGQSCTGRRSTLRLLCCSRRHLASKELPRYLLIANHGCQVLLCSFCAPSTRV